MSHTAHAPVEVAGLSKTFLDFWRRPKVKAVVDVSFALEPGEVFGLLGPNGSGKSTIVKTIVGLLFPTRGRVAVFGRSPRDVSVKKRVGLLPEETYLYPYLNAQETLDLYGRILDLPATERKRRIEALIDMVGLVGARRRALGEYSKGMARRLGIAQALIGDPDLVILDEPTTGLDPIGTREVKDMVLDLKKRGKTVLLSSHLLADVEDVCDRIGILYGGRLRVCGTVRDLLSQRELTRITAEGLTPETTEKIAAFVRQSAGVEPTVDHPMDRLENYFLKVVQEAAQSREEFSGAGIGGMQTSKVFGREKQAMPQPRNVLRDLVTPKAQPAPERAPDESPAEAPPAKTPVSPKHGEVLKKLARNRAEAPKPETPPAAKPAEAQSSEPTPADTGAPRKEAAAERAGKPKAPAKRNVLDRLTHLEKPADGGGKEPNKSADTPSSDRREPSP